MTEPNTAGSFGATSQKLTNAVLNKRLGAFLIEIVVIILGIVIALAIDSHLKGREERSVERDYLNRMLKDLAIIEQQILRYQTLESNNIRVGAELYQELSSTDPAFTPAQGDKLSLLASRKTLTLHSAAYRDLVNTGNLRLIEKTVLRQEIVEFFDQAERLQIVIEKNNSIFVDGIYLNFLVQTGIAWRPGVTHSGVALSTSDKDLLSHLGPNFALPDDLRGRAGDDISLIDDVRRMVLIRTRIASVGNVQAQDVLESTAKLRDRITEELSAQR